MQFGVYSAQFSCLRIEIEGTRAGATIRDLGRYYSAILATA